MSTKTSKNKAKKAISVLLNVTQLAEKLELPLSRARLAWRAGQIRADFVDGKGSPLFKLERLKDIDAELRGQCDADLDLDAILAQLVK